MENDNKKYEPNSALVTFLIFVSGGLIGCAITYWCVKGDFQLQAVRAGHAYWIVNDFGETTFMWKPTPK